MKSLLILVVFLFISMIMSSVHAHKPSDSYLFLEDGRNSAELRWDIALRDLEQVLGLDHNRDQQITWGEVKSQRDNIAAYAFARLRLERDNETCSPSLTELQIERHTDGAYSVLRINPGCAQSQHPTSLVYNLLFDIDATHRGIFQDKRQNRSTAPQILSPEHRSLDLRRHKHTLFKSFRQYLADGIAHIWIGFDHLLFIFTLMLPTVLQFKHHRWQAVEHLRPALLDLVKVMTAFTLAHSITLSLAVFNIVKLPSQLVESAIALSIIVVALNNLRPVFTHARWRLAFGFGLLHGFGFANVLIDLGLSSSSMIVSLLGFNLGVEMGQIALVTLVFPIAASLRHTTLYRHWVFSGGSTAAALIASIWMFERIFDYELIDF